MLEQPEAKEEGCLEAVRNWFFHQRHFFPFNHNTTVIEVLSSFIYDKLKKSQRKRPKDSIDLGVFLN